MRDLDPILLEKRITELEKNGGSQPVESWDTLVDTGYMSRTSTQDITDTLNLLYSFKDYKELCVETFFYGANDVKNTQSRLLTVDIDTTRELKEVWLSLPYSNDDFNICSNRLIFNSETSVVWGRDITGWSLPNQRIKILGRK